MKRLPKRHGIGRPWLAGVLASLCATLCATACVTENATTGEVIPRGKQKYPFERVEKAAESLKIGMSKPQTLLLLGSPAEQDEKGDVWVYLPERYGIIVPARALRLEFRNQALAEFAFQTIVLGARL
jgi:outer membrane protein assembly factor BamE (lipoprotein component of BamABCDE complex)